MSLETLIDYEFRTISAEEFLAGIDRLIALVDETSEGREPFHPKHCGPCWHCKLKQENAQ